MQPYVVLARRYRPGTFAEVLGQEPIAKTLANAIESGRIAHAYLFCGPRGVGKTSMARIFARALCCLASPGPTTTPCNECELCRAVAAGEDLDVIEIDGASNRGIEEIRTLRENAAYRPARARFKIYIIDEVHMLTEPAFNALLKTLEEPPSHVKFLFATTDPQKVPATILSRCQRFDFRRIPTRTIVAHLRKICAAEGVKASDDVLYAIASSATGGMRDAQSLLDQLITLSDGEIRPAEVASLVGTVSGEILRRILGAAAEGDEATALSLYESVHDEGVEPADFLKQLLALLRDLLVLDACGPESDLVDATPEGRAALHDLSGKVGRARILFGLSLVAETLKTAKLIGEGRALVCLALVKFARAARLRTLDAVVADLNRLKDEVGAGGAPARAAPAGPAAPPPPADARPPAAEGTGGERVLFAGGVAPPEGALAGEETVRTTIEGVREAWPAVLERVAARSSAAASFLRAGRVVGLTDDAVSVGFPPHARFQMGQLDDPDRIRIVEDAVAEAVGARLRFRAEAAEALPGETPDEGAAGGAGAAPAAADGEAPTPVTRSEVDRIQREPIVAALKEILSARLVNIERV